MSIYGPPGTGKTLTTRRVCREFAARHDRVAAEYVNLKECRTLFSAANEILFELAGEKKGAYEGLDGVFAGIWTALEAYPDWTVLLLDEIDHVQQDTNYDPSEFFYRLLRGEGKLARDISLSVWLVSNELLEVDLRLDSRVESAMSDEAVFFQPYGEAELDAILEPRVDRAFCKDAVPASVFDDAVREAARRWGDARKALTLFRQAGETASEQGLDRLTDDCIEANLERTEKAAFLEKVHRLPASHIGVLVAITARRNRRTGTVDQPVTTDRIHELLQSEAVSDRYRLGWRAIREVVRNLETMGLVETWIDAKGRDGRVKQIETTFEPTWMDDLQPDS